MSEAFPAIDIREFRLDLNENKALSESIFNRKRQVVSLAGGTGDRWEGVLSTPILESANTRTMMNFLVKVGIYGRFTLAHPDYSGPASGETSGLVQGASQSGTSLVVDGVTASTLILSEGEFFQVGDEFKRMTADATSNASGVVTLNFKPALRVSPADNATVTFTSPKLLLELTSMPSEDLDFTGWTKFTISFQEAMVHE